MEAEAVNAAAPKPDAAKTPGAARIAELLKREKYMRLLLENSPEIIVLFDRDGRVAFCSDALLRLLDIDDPSRVGGKSVRELYSLLGDEDFTARAERRFKDVKTNCRSFETNLCMDIPGKIESRMYTIKSTPMLDEDGLFDGVLVMYHDTTEVRDIEADEYTRLMLDATPLACSLWDEDGNMIDCNQEALRMYGLSEKSEYPERLADLNPEFQPDGASSYEKAEALEKAAFETGYQRFEWMHLTVTGEALPVETTLVRVPWKDGYRLATYSRDLREIIAGRKKMRDADRRNRELEVRTRAAQVASEAKSRFLASMSHEIRTPMNAIIGMSDLMRTDNLDETQRAYFDDIKKMSRALLQIINDILDFSKIEAAKMELVPVHFNLSELFDNICSMSRFIAETKDLAFNCRLDPALPHVILGDDVRIRQIIVNIVNNAVKYTREGHVDLGVSRAEKDGKPFMEIVVADTGIGIKKENFAKLFDPFRQFDKKNNRGIMGTGLGLSITKNLVAMMNGEIGLESEYGKGSVFRVLLPLAEGDPARIEKARFTSFSVAADDVSVLVVDDNRINLKVAVAYLAAHNIRADKAEDGRAAIRMIRQKPYDLVFMDHMMPDMDGVEAVKRIRAADGGKYAGVPVIALSANAVAGAREAFIEAGMNDFLSKPIDPKVLNMMLLKWLPPEKVFTETFFGDEEMPAPPKVSAQRPPVVDKGTGLENAAGDPAFYRQLLSNFTEDHAFDGRRISEATETGEKDVAMRIAHTLKSIAALIGAKGLSGIASEVERALTGKGAQLTGGQMQSLKDELDAVVADIEAELAFAASEPKPETANENTL
ncbi:MAG: response regulator [Clostridiales Family XIII bacterium]|jgi:signal transduction histidine kinase/CheY-like chemotaxis protein/HPt (histidine-containing phosphotransfer) domain-containing protein|nr:response regulator [Clostridiales Family XIII bacterium]